MIEEKLHLIYLLNILLMLFEMIRYFSLSIINIIDVLNNDPHHYVLYIIPICYHDFCLYVLQQATDATGDGPKPAATVDPKEVERLNAEITKQVR